MFSYVFLKYFFGVSSSHMRVKEKEKKQCAGKPCVTHTANQRKLAKLPTHFCHTVSEDTGELLMTNSNSFARKNAHKHYR